jgi:hypothetical protein
VSKRLFHGTRAELAPGDILRPAAWLGLPERVKTLNQPRYSPHFVYVTERLDYAHVFGSVYEVEPIGALVPDPDAKQAHRCRRARVVRLVAS